MKKRVLSVVLGVAMVSSMLMGCGAKPEKAPEEPAKEQEVAEEPAEETQAEEAPAEEAPAEEKKEEVTLKIAYMPNYGSLWAVMPGIQKGYFAEEGINIELVEFADGPTIISAMESGSIDMGYIGQGAHKLCINGKASIFALTHLSNGDAVIGGPAVKSVADLKGKKVAYSSGSSSEDILVNTLTKEGMAMTDIQAVDMDAASIVTAMISGGVDACATWSPQTLQILDEVKDSTKLTDNLTFKDTTVSIGSWIVMPKYAQEKKDIIVRFARALYKGMDYAAKENQDENAGWIATQLAQDREKVFAQRGDAEWLTGKEMVAGLEDGSIKKYYEIQKKNFIDTQAVTVDPPVEDYVLFDIMKEAGNY